MQRTANSHFFQTQGLLFYQFSFKIKHFIKNIKLILTDIRPHILDFFYKNLSQSMAIITLQVKKYTSTSPDSGNLALQKRLLGI